jgi:hypothetical protein
MKTISKSKSESINKVLGEINSEIDELNSFGKTFVFTNDKPIIKSRRNIFKQNNNPRLLGISATSATSATSIDSLDIIMAEYAKWPKTSVSESDSVSESVSESVSVLESISDSELVQIPISSLTTKLNEFKEIIAKTSELNDEIKNINDKIFSLDRIDEQRRRRQSIHSLINNK